MKGITAAVNPSVSGSRNPVICPKSDPHEDEVCFIKMGEKQQH